MNHTLRICAVKNIKKGHEGWISSISRRTDGLLADLGDESWPVRMMVWISVCTWDVSERWIAMFKKK